MFYIHRDRTKVPTVFIDEVEVKLPTKWAICGTCDGDGGHSIRFGAFSGRRLEEARQDEEFWEAYMSGQFDERCEECQGTGKIRVVSTEKMTAAQKQAYHEDREFEAECDADSRAEYMMSEEYRQELRGDY